MLSFFGTFIIEYKKATILVISSAIKQNNVEIKAAKKNYQYTKGEIC